ncbi:hypothetical protein QR680_015961 [Steinernema hermaphroditum]|uniref:Invertebrate defensins family profile domain-containing protein n=1 Tax=Steinernema hermaphroditum TaxID=289476 RepID=A0AA39HBH2_9BILA|nr:hypothetical protein QR680_015961 [Steinernema hermaphroditum]
MHQKKLLSLVILFTLSVLVMDTMGNPAVVAAVEEYCCQGHFACSSHCKKTGCGGAQCSNFGSCQNACICSNCRG